MKLFEPIGQWKSTEGVSRENSYNMIRLLAASFVIYGHMYILNGEVVGTWLGIPVHTLGFKILMIISGYMITQSCVRDGNLLHYWIKRACRLLPGMIACIVLTTFVLGAILTTMPLGVYMEHPGTWYYLKQNLLLYPVYALPGVFENNTYPYAVNGSLWALPVEVSLYAVIWLVLFLGGRWKWRKHLFGGITASICIFQLLRIVYFPEQLSVHWGTDWLSAYGMYPYFFIGAAFYLLPIRRYCNIGCAALLLMIGAVLRFKGAFGYELLSYIILPYAVITFGEQKSRLSTKMQDITYGVFLWGFPIQQTFIYLCAKVEWHPGVNAGFVVCMMLAAGMGVLSANTIEKWGMLFGKKLTVKKTEQNQGER